MHQGSNFFTSLPILIIFCGGLFLFVFCFFLISSHPNECEVVCHQSNHFLRSYLLGSKSSPSDLLSLLELCLEKEWMDSEGSPRGAPQRQIQKFGWQDYVTFFWSVRIWFLTMWSVVGMGRWTDGWMDGCLQLGKAFLYYHLSGSQRRLMLS